MPPKAKKNEPSKKTEAKKKEKVIEDKTFGLKNKKGGKQQKFIQNVEKQVKFGNISARKAGEVDQATKKKELQEKKKKELEELNLLFRPVQQKASKDADPKSILCAFFKQGACSKGDKCKFSHDLAVERKGEKRSLYVDARGDEDTMDQWDEQKLEDVVTKKHGEADKAKPKTDIICKHFLTAIENKKYGWFWECPNGDKCIYRHALPPGFVLKKDVPKTEKKDEISIEELVETERAALGPNVTKVTLESFLAWKERKLKEKKELFHSEQEKKKSDYKAGKIFGISGREMFTFKPDLALEDDEEADDVYEREYEDGDDDDGTQAVEITAESLALLATNATDAAATPNVMLSNVDEATKLAEASALPNGIDASVNSDGPEAGEEPIPINEDLFDPDDLDDLEEDLENLDLESQ